MIDLSSEQKGPNQNTVASQDELDKPYKAKVNFGTHFLSQIKKLKEDGAFDKIKEIDNNEIQRIGEDIEFFKLKAKNLLTTNHEIKIKRIDIMKRNEHFHLNLNQLQKIKSINEVYLNIKKELDFILTEKLKSLRMKEF